VNLMSESGASTKNKQQLENIIGLAIEDENFRRSLLDNAKEAIDSNSQKLQLSYDELSKEVKEILPAFTADEFDTLSKIHGRASRVGAYLEPKKML
jgi:hypothetical protein